MPVNTQLTVKHPSPPRNVLPLAFIMQTHTHTDELAKSLALGTAATGGEGAEEKEREREGGEAGGKDGRAGVFGPDLSMAASRIAATAVGLAGAHHPSTTHSTNPSIAVFGVESTRALGRVASASGGDGVSSVLWGRATGTDSRAFVKEGGASVFSGSPTTREGVSLNVPSTAGHESASHDLSGHGGGGGLAAPGFASLRGSVVGSPSSITTTIQLPISSPAATGGGGRDSSVMSQCSATVGSRASWDVCDREFGQARVSCVAVCAHWCSVFDCAD